MKNLKYLLVVCLVAAAFFFLYFATFRGTVLIENLWDRMPMEFEGQGYACLALGRCRFATTDHFVLFRHIFMGVAYYPIHQALVKIFSNPQSPLVCSFGVVLGIAVFGFWLYRRTRRAGLSLTIALLLGFSFTTWYVGSVWESRSWIFLGAVAILLAVDRLIRKPVLSSLILCVAATVLMLLICLGNLYNLVLVPAALFLLSRSRELRRKILPEGKLGWRFSLAARKITGRRALLWSGIYLISVLGVVLGIYLYSGTINPGLRLSRVMAFNLRQTSERASWERLADPRYLRVNALQALVYSVGGLRLPCRAENFRPRLVLSHGRRGRTEAYRDYFGRMEGVGFILSYSLLVGFALFAGLRRKIHRRDRLLAVIFIWIVVYTMFFIYMAPDGSEGFAAELMAPLWAGIGISLSRVRPRKTIPLLLLLLLFTVWNNLRVMAYFRGYYNELYQEEFVRGEKTRWETFVRRNLLYRHPATITADSHNLESESPDRAIDQDPRTFWHVCVRKIGQPTWLQVEFEEQSAFAARAVALYPREDIPEQFLRDARLLGSFDGVDWEPLVSIHQEEPPRRGELRRWGIPGARTWNYYRLEITSGHTNGSFLSLAEFGLLD